MQAAILAITDENNDYERQIAAALAQSRQYLLITNKPVPELQAPQFLLRNPFSPAALFRLWRWQAKNKPLLLVAIGKESLKLARIIKKMDRQTVIAVYFPAETPQGCKATELAPVKICLCGSSYIGEEISALLSGQKQGAPKPEVHIALPGIDLAGYVIPPVPQERFIFGMAESLSPDSGALLVVRAMSALWQQPDLPGWEVRMYGSGPRFTEIMEEAENLGVLSRLSLLSDQPLPDATQHCCVWLVPGTSSCEYPATFWAGFAAGLPVIASESNLHKERLFDSNAALLINGNKPQELAKAMLDVMHSGTLREDLAASGIGLRPSISMDGMANRIWKILSPDTEIPPRAILRSEPAKKTEQHIDDL